MKDWIHATRRSALHLSSALYLLSALGVVCGLASAAPVAEAAPGRQTPKTSVRQEKAPKRAARPKASRAPAPAARVAAPAAPASPTAPGAAGAANPAAAVVKTEELREGEKTYTFGAQEVEGRLKSPQILYFLRRVRAEFDPAPLGHRSFLLELSDTRRHPAFE